jgi:hypothetical protein
MPLLFKEMKLNSVGRSYVTMTRKRCVSWLFFINNRHSHLKVEISMILTVTQ